MSTTTEQPCRTVGVEVELLAPAGSNRRDLALHIASRTGGSVEPFFHLDSEPSKVSGKPVFYHLTQGFRVLDAQGRLLAKCVDDITLQRDLDKKSPPQDGWYRIVSDDVRLLRLLLHHTSADSAIADCLKPLGDLFGTQPAHASKGVYRLLDEAGASLALAAPLPGERERACELITAPLPADDRDTLPMLLDCARELGFTLPNEGATHLHFDATPFCSATVLSDTMQLLHAQREPLRELLHTNPYCRRLGAWPDELMQRVSSDDFRQLGWPEAQQQLRALKPSKYCDVNIRNLALNITDKHTLEVRTLPATLDAASIFAAIDGFQALFAGILNQRVSQELLLAAFMA
ncbi:MAG: amidoligase family protein [Thiolinea sp.]